MAKQRRTNMSQEDAYKYLRERNEFAETLTEAQRKLRELGATQTRMMKVIEKLTADGREQAKIITHYRNALSYQNATIESLLALVDPPFPVPELVEK